MLFLMIGGVDLLKAVDSENSFENTFNAPKILKFEGVQSYTVDDIRKSLSNSAEYWTAAYRNLSTEHYTASVQRLIRAGYLHGGFADVEVYTKFNKENTPNPSRSDVEIINIEGGHYAVIRYSGRASNNNFIKVPQSFNIRCY